MKPRFVGRVGVADVVSAANASLGFLAVVVAPTDPRLAARLVLFAAVADGLDGVLARRYGGTDAGEYLDSLADVSSFAVAPAALVTILALREWPLGTDEPLSLVVLGIAGLFVAMAVMRLALYTAYDVDGAYTDGVPSTLAATVLSAAVLAGAADVHVLVAATAIFCYLMVAPIQYPDLLAQDALVMGVVHSLAVLFPDFYGRMFPWALLYLALAYLLFGPFFYWRDWGGTDQRAEESGESGDS
ncbi:CDP-diacylglycerol--serine O-phosphatidyltransferase [Halobacteriales archaeon QS_1_68_20]|nr:MAG: CDP-diacylglycerol--serine O-phosphatidyltransferase [Halobacteriales archaeon QS_1_68_20]